MKNVLAFRSVGYTLVELLLVIAILALVAIVAVPRAPASSDKQLWLAAEEMAAAIRFARSEALRTGQPHGFVQEDAAKRIRVVSVDLGTTPATLNFDVYNPFDKQLYDYQIDQQSLAAAGNILRTATFRGTCSVNGEVYFDANGTPWCTNPDSVLLDHFNLMLTLGNDQRQIVLDGFTGRVTVQ